MGLSNTTNNIDNVALKREDHGQLLWDLKEKTKRPLDDLSMEFVINTAIRNKVSEACYWWFWWKVWRNISFKKDIFKKIKCNIWFGIN